MRRPLTPLLAALGLLLALPSGAATSAPAPASPVVAVTPTAGGAGYWLATRDGEVLAFGDARHAGSLVGRPRTAPIVGMAADPDGAGYWLVASDGGVFAFDAPFLGSVGGRRLNAPVLGMAADPDGRGYWLVARDGGVFSFGSAAFRGSTGGQRLNRPVVGIAADPDGDGYWLVAEDGGIFSFAAAFAGSTGGRRLASPIVGMAADPDRRGYWLVAGDGGVFSFDAPFLGSRGGAPRSAPFVGLAASRTAGYWLAGADGSVFPYGGATQQSNLGTPTLAVETVVGGLTVPWDVGFGPGGELFYTERPGRFSVRVGSESRLLGAPGDVFASGEGGMLGLAVDPNFATSRRVYVCQSWSDGRSRDVRVYAWAVAGDLRAATRLEPPLVAGMPAGSGRHNGCRPRVGPDGFLWIATGDAAIGTNAQDLGSLGGKVLRVDRVFGAPASGNPIAGSRIYTFGHRNVQGLAFRPGTSQVFSVEHGPDRDDEVNLLRAGANAGWDPVPGYDEDVPMTDLRKFPGALSAVWSSGSPTVAPSGADFLAGPQWRSWEGRLAVAMLKGAHLRTFTLDGAGRVVGDETVLRGQGRLRSAVLGPDGSLYLTTSNGSGDRILRVTPG